MFLNTTQCLKENKSAKDNAEKGKRKEIEKSKYVCMFVCRITASSASSLAESFVSPPGHRHRHRHRHHHHHHHHH